jgi:hypothetical protein
MGPEPRQRAFLAVRIAAVLLAVAVVLVLASRTSSNPKDTGPKATHSPQAAPSSSVRDVAPSAANVPASPAQVTAERPLCQAAPSLVRFSIQVLGPPHQGGAINVSNAGTVANAAQARSMAGQFCALPVLPAQPEPCPATGGPWFQLIFAAGDGEYWTVWATDGGCEQVIGVGDQTRTARPADPRLWRALLADLRAAQPLTP